MLRVVAPCEGEVRAGKTKESVSDWSISMW